MRSIAITIVIFFLALQTAWAAVPIKPADPCFKKSFEKKSVRGDSWLVKQCTGPADGVEYIQVDMRDAKLQHYVASFAADDAESIADIQYTLIAPDTLFIELRAERGGRGYLLHPVSGAKMLSTRQFKYMTGDEDGIEIKQNGNNIHAKTRYEEITVSLDEQGALGAARTVPTRRGSGKH